jgi:MYXO-CTERM domain-containing protein
LRRHAKIFGFALSPDGSSVVAGYGDPKQPTRDVYPEDVGIYRATTADLAGTAVVAMPFTQALNDAVSCLTWNDHGLYACFDGMVGVSPDGSIPATSSGFTKVLANEEVRGPLACNATTCLPEWQMGREDIAAVCDRLSAECEVDPTSHVLTCDGGASGSGTGGSGGSGGSSMGGSSTGGATSAGNGPVAGMGGAATSGASSGGRAGSATNAGQAGTSSNDDDVPYKESSCGCRSPRPSGNAGAVAALVLLALLGLRKRQTRMMRSHSD